MVKEAAIPPAGQSFSGKDAKPGTPSGNLVVKCPKCREILLVREWEKNLKVCSRCNFHFKLSAYERIDLLVDPGSFVETDQDMVSVDPLKFVSRTKDDVQVYAKKLDDERQKVGLNEAVVSGYATVETLPLALAVMDFRFIGGSMGSVVGEKITRAIELGNLFRVRWCPHAGGPLLADANGQSLCGTGKIGRGETPFLQPAHGPYHWRGDGQFCDAW